jgi:hypothetical protein
MEGKGRYFYDSFSADAGKFGGLFTDYLNQKYGDGWKVKGCDYHMDGGRSSAHCIFKAI